ncbi:FecR family protein [Arenibacter sp. ARW7G5Y1]|uniref:FecR family protein n=1 Tax=Arenibacter sp. ARW7G5Y1 TaxID=2135619 RepID=UPI000D760C79|nr:FecR domain-containing protein [Arenibacter sp. ARW7G5Y1]PXX23719.1 FecR family protein [Arenibacter sp. ARW7G5Y1]
MDIVTIIVKRIKADLTESEERYFEDWINASEENRLLFQRLKAMDPSALEPEHIADLDVMLAWKKVLGRSGLAKNNMNSKFNIKSILKYAAVGVLFFGLMFGYWQYDRPAQIRENNKNAIILKLENGEVRQIAVEDLQTIINSEGRILGKQMGSQLDYSYSTIKEGLVYNELSIPYGQKFSLVLSDGTLVHLNAGSTLKYPVKFIEGQIRQVYLKGEAFFDVFSDGEHPFVVSNEDMNIRVLGTKFNVSAYPEDKEINTVLVEGLVSLYGPDEVYDEVKSALLEPGYKAEWDRFYKKISYEMVDTDVYTGWMDGKLVIRKMPFDHILKKLQRQYMVVIDNKYKELDKRTFTATFDVETIEEVLKTFAEETPFEYEIAGGHITIMPPKINNQLNETPME